MKKNKTKAVETRVFGKKEIVARLKKSRTYILQGGRALFAGVYDEDEYHRLVQMGS